MECDLPRRKSLGAGEAAGQLRALVAPVEDVNLVPRTHTMPLTIACNSNSAGSDTSGLCRLLYTYVYSYNQTQNQK